MRNINDINISEIVLQMLLHIEKSPKYRIHNNDITSNNLLKILKIHIIYDRMNQFEINFFIFIEKCFTDNHIFNNYKYLSAVVLCTF